MKKFLLMVVIPFLGIAQGIQPYNTQTAKVNGSWDNCGTWNNPVRIYTQTKKQINNGVIVNLIQTQPPTSNPLHVSSNEIKFVGNGRINLGSGSISFVNMTNPINCSSSYSDVIDNVIVNFNEIDSSAKSQTGFLQGLGGNTYWNQDSINRLPLRSSISELKPKMFRQNHRRYYQDSYDLTKTSTEPGRVHMIVSGEWISEKEQDHPGVGVQHHNYINPIYNGDNWAAYDLYLSEYFNWGYNDGNVLPGIVWECWNEPDHNNPETTGELEPIYIPYNHITDNDHWPYDPARQNFYAIYKRFYEKLRGSSLPPTALVAGPSIGYFKKEYLQEFFDYCLANNLEVNVVTWHEINYPNKMRPYTQIKERVDWVRKNFMENPIYAALKIKSIEINETISLYDTNNPAALLASIGNLEKAGVDYSCKSCWGTWVDGIVPIYLDHDDNPDTPDIITNTVTAGRASCFDNSLNDLYTVSYETPLTQNPTLIDDAQNPNKTKSAWWVYKLYGDGVKDRVKSYFQEGRGMVLANKAPYLQQQAQVLFGYVKGVDDQGSYLPDNGIYKFKLNSLQSAILPINPNASQYYKIKVYNIPYNDVFEDGILIQQDNFELLSPFLISEVILPLDISGNITYDFNLTEKDNLYQMTIENVTLNEYQQYNSTATRIDQSHQPEIKIYPNPSEGIFTIDFPEQTKDFAKIDVYNLLGQKILENQIEPNSNQQIIDLVGYPRGTYLVSIFDGINNEVKKIIKE
jgi:Secretion system C-terminal sorting domain